MRINNGGQTMTIKKSDTLRIPFIIAILMVFIFINAGISNAETRQTDTNTPAAGNSFVFVPATDSLNQLFIRISVKRTCYISAHGVYLSFEFF